MHSKGFIGIAVLLTVFIVGILLISAYAIKRKTPNEASLTTQRLFPTLKPSPKTTIQTTNSPTPTPYIIEGENGWKTYIDKQHGYQIDFPSSWYIQGFPTLPSDSVLFKSTKSANRFNPETEQVDLSCPLGGWERKNLPVPNDWEGGDAGITTKYYSKIVLNNMEGVQFIWGTPKETVGRPINNLCTALLEKSVPYVCRICTPVTDRDEYNKEFILKLENYNKILSTFRFLPSGPSEIETAN